MQGASALATAASNFSSMGAQNNNALAGARTDAWRQGTDAFATGLSGFAKWMWPKGPNG
jgi:hypothetical protein